MRLAEAADGSLDSRMRWPVLGVSLPLPLACWRCEGQVVWGLTYAIVRRLLRLGERGG
jgi:hypothetical protein